MYSQPEGGYNIKHPSQNHGKLKCRDLSSSIIYFSAAVPFLYFALSAVMLRTKISKHQTIKWVLWMNGISRELSLRRVSGRSPILQQHQAFRRAPKRYVYNEHFRSTFRQTSDLGVLNHCYELLRIIKIETT